MSTPSVIALWQRYRASDPSTLVDLPLVEHFCNDEEDANRYAALVSAGRKRATASALSEYVLAGKPLPEPCKLVIITDWSGEAKALIETRRVTICRFEDVPVSFAASEGEGDGSLAWWRDEHRSFWNCSPTSVNKGADDFQVVCDEFDILLIA